MLRHIKIAAFIITFAFLVTLLVNVGHAASHFQRSSALFQKNTCDPSYPTENPKDFVAVEVFKNVLQISYKTTRELAATFLRFQEYYESPQFRGQIFSLEEYQSWYVKENKGFTYYCDWEGFNIPSYVLKPFRDGKFQNITERERVLLDVTANLTEPFYIIGSADADVETLKHELAHSLYYVSADYKSEVDAVLKTIPRLSRLKQYLLKSGYQPDVVMDELQAYFVEGGEFLKREKLV